MLLAWNTLEEAADYLSSKTSKKWTMREVIQACLDNGIFPHVQILTDRPELPLWVREAEMAELPFNLDLQRFLSGDGVVHIVRRKGLIYKITPGIKYESKHLRLSKAALCELLLLLKRKAEQPEPQPTASITKAEIDENAFEKELAALFDPVPVEFLEKMFPADGKWKQWADKAKATGLICARKARAKFNPYQAGMWFIRKGGKGWDEARLYRTLANNLPARSRDSKHLLTRDTD